MKREIDYAAQARVRQAEIARQARIVIERRAFENWFRTLIMDADNPLRRDGDGYKHEGANWAWLAWQARVRK